MQIMYLIRGQNPKYIRDTYESMTKKKKRLKGRRTELRFFPKKTYKWPQVHEKVRFNHSRVRLFAKRALNIINHRGDDN